MFQVKPLVLPAAAPILTLLFAAQLDLPERCLEIMHDVFRMLHLFSLTPQLPAPWHAHCSAVPAAPPSCWCGSSSECWRAPVVPPGLAAVCLVSLCQVGDWRP